MADGRGLRAEQLTRELERPALSSVLLAGPLSPSARVCTRAKPDLARSPDSPRPVRGARPSPTGLQAFPEAFVPSQGGAGLPEAQPGCRSVGGSERPDGPVPAASMASGAVGFGPRQCTLAPWSQTPPASRALHSADMGRGALHAPDKEAPHRDTRGLGVPELAPGAPERGRSLPASLACSRFLFNLTE